MDMSNHGGSLCCTRIGYRNSHAAGGRAHRVGVSRIGFGVGRGRPVSLAIAFASPYNPQPAHAASWRSPGRIRR